MKRYIIKRVFVSIFILWAVLTATFLFVHLAPGDPSMLYIQPEIDQQVVANIRSQFGFDEPIWKQYAVWVNNLICGNFGVSFTQHRAVSSILAEAIPNTLRLTLTVLIVQFVFGIGLGIICAVKRRSKIDTAINTLLLFFYSMPGFWIALIAIMVFSLYLGWLPSSQMRSLRGFDVLWMQFWDSIRHLILPTLILAIPFVSYTTQFVRDKLIDVFQQPYILAAKVYGLKRSKIMFQYALKNTLLPLITLAGMYLPFLLGGAVITEFIFAWPGMGRITINAIFTHDYPLILASNFVATIAVILGNLISDTLYFFADPRIRFATVSQN